MFELKASLLAVIFAGLLIALSGCVQQADTNQQISDTNGQQFGCASCDVTIEKKAAELCGRENIGSIYVCGVYVRTVSSLLGGGSTFYEYDIGKLFKEAECPVVGTDSVSGKCSQLSSMKCKEEEISCPQIVGNDKDEHGCIPSAGYSWCEEKQKCLRQWEEDCNVTDKNTNCAGDGETIGVYPGAPKCCQGLTPINPTTPDRNCELMVGGATCSNCGNQICESWENYCNCPEDCPNAN